MRRMQRMVLMSAVSWLVFKLVTGGSEDAPANAGGDLVRAARDAMGVQASVGGDLVGRPAPPLQVETWLTPVPDPAGRMVLVDFWATWCPPCRAAIPHLNDFARRFSDRLVVVGLSNESADTVRAMTSPRIEYASAVDPSGRMSRAVGVTAIPHVLLVDPQGVVRWQGFPFERGHELTAEVVEELLDEYVSVGG